jgi:hypothetical protein
MDDKDNYHELLQPSRNQISATIYQTNKVATASKSGSSEETITPCPATATKPLPAHHQPNCFVAICDRQQKLTWLPPLAYLNQGNIRRLKVVVGNKITNN